jgi:histidinol-phosphate aminotransferase
MLGMPLDRNESYWLLDEDLAGVARSIGAVELSRYPDYAELKGAIASYAGCAKEQVLLTSGSVSAIEHIARAYGGDGGGVLLPVPTFYGYESILTNVRAQVTPIVYREREGRFIFPLEETVERLTSGSAKVLFLCHPNNPLGCPLTGAEVSALVKAARGGKTLVVADEAYFEFSSGLTFLPHLANVPNLVVIRTFSKSFAFSGGRVGYAIAAPEIVTHIEGLMVPWSVAHPSAVIALRLLARADDVAARRGLVIATRDHFIQELSMLPGVAAYPSETNFALIRVPDAGAAHTAFLSQGIRVALGESMSRFPEARALLKNTLRIAVPDPETEELCVKVLREVLDRP